MKTINENQLGKAMIQEAQHIADFNHAIFEKTKGQDYSQALRMQSDAMTQIDGIAGLCIHLEVYKDFDESVRDELKNIRARVNNWTKPESEKRDLPSKGAFIGFPNYQAAR